MGCCYWHHCGPSSHWYPYQPEAEMYPPRRRRARRDVEDDARDYLQYLEGEVAAVRRELEELTARTQSAE
jgi:hypothetical protein